LPAFIAQGKGRSFFGWWIYGMLLFIVALPHSLIIKENKAAIEEVAIADGGKYCPFCAEIVKAAALKCKHCGSDLTVEPIAKKYVSSLAEAQDAGLLPKGVTFDGSKYCFDVYRYDTLEDAIRHAKKHQA
jgi:hypothetical protein